MRKRLFREVLRENLDIRDALEFLLDMWTFGTTKELSSSFSDTESRRPLLPAHDLTTTTTTHSTTTPRSASMPNTKPSVCGRVRWLGGTVGWLAGWLFGWSDGWIITFIFFLIGFFRWIYFVIYIFFSALNKFVSFLNIINFKWYNILIVFLILGQFIKLN